MRPGFRIGAKQVRLALMGLMLLLAVVRYGERLVVVAAMFLAGLVLAFVMDPLVSFLERSGVRRRGVAVALSFLVVLIGLAGTVLLALPPLIAQGKELSFVMARLANLFKEMLQELNRFLAVRQLPLIDARAVDWGAMTRSLTEALPLSAAIAGGLIERLSELGLSLMLAFYFLLYKESLLLSVELCIPMAARRTATQVALKVVGELRQYLRGQLTIAALVGALSALLLLLIGAPSAILMGVLMGICNMIPYFGPLIGAIPAVLLGLTVGVGMALSTAAVAFFVQQVDGFWISPRVMGGMMGLNPPAVLMAITLGSGLFGIGGMFFAIPVLLIARICLRAWMMREESVEKWPRM